MSTTIRSFAKINIGLRIGPRRDDGYHELRTLYQTIALHDLIKIEAVRGTGIEIYCADPRVPCNESNTCWRVAEKVLRTLKVRSKVRITIEKNLPVQGGLGAASSNAVATMLGMERALKRQLAPDARLRIASEVGSDLPLFLIGGTVLGIGRGEQVYAVDDLPGFHCVIAAPDVGVSTPVAFAAWDAIADPDMGVSTPAAYAVADKVHVLRTLSPQEKRTIFGLEDVSEQGTTPPKLTGKRPSDKINTFSHSVYEWLIGSSFSPTGVPGKGWDRAEAMLLDLVRTGMENDFERVVFPLYPSVRQVKQKLEREGAKYVSLSGSGSSVYGLFSSRQEAARAAKALNQAGVRSQVTSTLPRARYWKDIFPAKIRR